jgi:glutamine amidotransferase
MPRYISSRTSEASSLFFSSGTSFDEYQEGGLYRMTRADKRENVIMIGSEPLTFERSDWMEVKTNTMLVITPKVPPQDPASQHRSKDFAIEMGFGEWYEVTPNSKGLGDVTLTMTRPWLRLYGRRGHRSGIVHGVWSTAMGVAY